MTVFWFVLAALALIGAAVVMYIERRGAARPAPQAPAPPPPRGRRDWARLRGLDYDAAEAGLTTGWRRGAFEEYPGAGAVDVASGLLDDSPMRVFGLDPESAADAGTVIALQRPSGSTVVFDLRSETSPAPADPEVHILGAIGRFFAFSNDLGVARRVCDRRMVSFAEAAPGCIGTMWSEDDWCFAWLDPGASPDDWDDAIAATARFSSLLRLLPPPQEQAGSWPVAHDPGAPLP